MQVRLLFFGMLKEVTGREAVRLELPEGSRVSDLLEHYAASRPELQPYYDVIAVAVNQEYSEAGAVLKDGDEVALIPPVSGGKVSERSGGETPPGQSAGPRYAKLVREKIESQAVVDGIKRPEDGAVAVFEGIVRNHSLNRRTLYLDYEAYEPMALKEMESIAEAALQKFAIREVALAHRLGRLQIGETSVLIVVASAHRAAAFDACRWLIDTLKKTVPIWKKEYFEDGAVWADGDPFPDEVRKAGEQATPAASK
jgi:molybdopterin converting factor subunit 1